jgi:hypothetical protein
MAFSLGSRFFRNKTALLILFLLSGLMSVRAQPVITGYTGLGVFNGHYYYISQTYYFGQDISAAVADARAKILAIEPGRPADQVYAAAILNQAENNFIANAVLNYNTAHFGGVGKSTFESWGDPRNPWIGLTDALHEGNFTWSNEQVFCQDYRNWNVGEPNNFGGDASNGEDFVQMLIMNPYLYNGSMNDPFGKWNDWFNQYISNNGVTETKLPVIIEVGLKDCTPPPPPPVIRGNYGCSHGYWKNCADKSWTDAGYSRPQKFSAVFGITNGRSTITIGVTTLQQSLEIGGGGYKNLARQGTGALLNAARGFFPYTKTEILTAVQSMFNNGTATLPNVTVSGHNYTGGSYNDAGVLASYLDYLNNLGCPLNNAGNMSSVSSRTAPLGEDAVAKNKFDATANPNPSSGVFVLQLEGVSNETVSVRVVDMTGRLVEERSNVAANQSIRIGEKYAPGLYFVQVKQGLLSKQLKLVKQ